MPLHSPQLRRIALQHQVPRFVERTSVMRHPLLMLHLLGLRLSDQLRQALDARAEDPERGSVTIEQVAWAAAVIAIVAIAVAAIKAYVTSQVGRL